MLLPRSYISLLYVESQHMHIKHCVKTKIVYTENSIKIMKLRAK